jgi:hypothetical protein
MRRLVALASLALLAAALLASSAHGALFFLFKPTAADAGDIVTVRLGGTPPGFTLEDRKQPFQRAIRLYLVPNDIAATVRTRFDPRLHFLGALVPDRDGRGILTFEVPPLDSDAYAVAAWCPRCLSFGKSFTVLPVTPNGVGRFRHLQVLDVRLPEATASSCPATTGRVGNGFLFVTVADDGVRTMRREPDGTLFDKLGWTPKKGWGGNLAVRGERLDAPGSARVLNVFWGHTYVNGSRGRGGWMTPVVLPSEGCWRFSGRVGDITISYVVRVVARP